ncbi:uncharacterized protein LOC126897856 [Daktulosphaira vitifoliae]|uniref:uncharacterized protein LOC126897856 n=1 Tax=Daktulosphaira vitifoliae TaxID=58002 RepID=UPI0021AAE6E5|nr:uncharacterized protein LOC126897856 [Daktulosphaira vitifoliae]
MFNMWLSKLILWYSAFLEKTEHNNSNTKNLSEIYKNLKTLDTGYNSNKITISCSFPKCFRDITRDELIDKIKKNYGMLNCSFIFYAFHLAKLMKHCEKNDVSITENNLYLFHSEALALLVNASFVSYMEDQMNQIWLIFGYAKYLSVMALESKYKFQVKKAHEFVEYIFNILALYSCPKGNKYSENNNPSAFKVNFNNNMNRSELTTAAVMDKLFIMKKIKSFSNFVSMYNHDSYNSDVLDYNSIKMIESKPVMEAILDTFAEIPDWETQWEVLKVKSESIKRMDDGLSNWLIGIGHFYTKFKSIFNVILYRILYSYMLNIVKLVIFIKDSNYTFDIYNDKMRYILLKTIKYFHFHEDKFLKDILLFLEEEINNHWIATVGDFLKTLKKRIIDITNEYYNCNYSFRMCSIDYIRKATATLKNLIKEQSIQYPYQMSENSSSFELSFLTIRLLLEYTKAKFPDINFQIISSFTDFSLKYLKEFS